MMLLFLAFLLVAALLPGPGFLPYSSLVQADSNYNSGYWYGGDRAPYTKYDTVPYAKLTVKIKADVNNGPGDHLVRDPENPVIELYTGQQL